MAKLWWNLRLAYYLVRYYRATPMYALHWANDECWQQYREDEYSPRDAFLEDLSYAD
jgi:hypothetical protein